MFIDYITLMLINMVCGLVIIALFLLFALDKPDKGSWAPAFGIVGLVAIISGFVMTFTWPLPKPYNIPYGEMSVFFGVLFLGAAYSTAKNLSYLPLSIYSFFAGMTAVLIGVRLIDLGLTNNPALAGTGFILTGLGGVFAALTLWLNKFKPLRIAGAAIMLAAAAIWLWTGCLAYWMHLVPPR